MSIREFFASLRKPSETPSTGGATDLLREDHKVVKQLFAKFEETEKTSEKRRLISAIVDELTVHATLEEKLVYPIFDKLDHEANGEAKQEHHVVKFLVRELKNSNGITDEIAAKVKVLKEIVEHHVKEEEEEIFPKLESSDADMVKLGEELKAKKKQLKDQSKAKKSASIASKKSASKPSKKSSPKKVASKRQKTTVSKKAS